MYSINFTENNKKNHTLHYNGANSFLFVNGREIVATLSCLGNISKD